jgi:hypothetical protein
VRGGDVLQLILSQGLDAGTLLAADTTTEPSTNGVTTLTPLVVLLVVLWMFLTDKITTVAAVARLREADNNRFTDMVAQRDALVASLEKSNESLSVATRSAQQSLDLVKDLVPEQTGRRRSAAT